MMIDLDRITFDPQVMHGKPYLRNMVPVALLLNLLADGKTPAQIIQHYPPLELEDIRQALLYAASLADRTEPALA